MSTKTETPRVGAIDAKPAKEAKEPRAPKAPSKEPAEHIAQTMPQPVNDNMERCDITHAQRPLALKMARIMASVKHVPKKGRHDFLNYDYITEGDLVESLRGKLAEQGVMLFPSIKDHMVQLMEDPRGRAQYLATVTLEMTFIDGDSGDQVTTVWVGQGVDAGDKSYYKAYTGAFKYALLKTFMVTGEEDSAQRAIRKPKGQGAAGRRRA